MIVGGGGLGREVHELIEDINDEAPRFNVLGWLDSNLALHGSAIHGLPVLGDLRWLSQRPDVGVVVGIGAPHIRRRVVQAIQAQGPNSFPTLIHPTARIGRRVSIGEGTVICANVTTTTDYSIGQHVLVNIMATVAHDNLLGDFVTLAPGALLSGNVTVGEGCDIGTNATLLQGVSIGEWSIVGAAAMVREDLPANCTAVGVPAKVIKERPPNWA